MENESALRGGLNISDLNHAARLVESSVDRHLFAAKALGFRLVVELIGGCVSFENILLLHLDHGARKGLLGLSIG
jgi:hypothetical protein